jgi:hypothetical protein
VPLEIVSGVPRLEGGDAGVVKNGGVVVVATVFPVAIGGV